MGVMNLRAICPKCGGKIHTQPKGLGHLTWARSWFLVQTGTTCQHCGVALSGRVKAGNKAELASEAERRANKKAARRQERSTSQAERALTSGTTAAPRTPAGWFPDPSGSGQELYWDGATWMPRPCPGCGESVSIGVLDCPHCSFDFRAIGAQSRQQIKAGWYPDSRAAGGERFWDGLAWTEQTRPSGVGPVASSLDHAVNNKAATPTKGSGRTGRRTPNRLPNRAVVVLVVVGAMVGIAIFGNHSHKSSSTASGGSHLSQHHHACGALRTDCRPLSAHESPACRTDREELKTSEAGVSSWSRREQQTYVAEDKEMISEECGAAGRKRYAKVQSESPRETQCKVAQMLLSEAEADDIPSYIREGKEMVSASCG
ncbi:MAG TPA: DUF2510 domain-containing protein [Solirubrobacterales bacterium]|nr:DUF2510 domain-containing protein [Solirubrobacterales bacterium]